MRARFVMVIVLAMPSYLGMVPARADLLYLVNGGHIEGRLLNPDESPRASYVVQTEFGGRLTLDSDQVKHVVVKSEAERRYEAFLPSVADTPEGHLDAAQRCERAGLKEQKHYHLEQVLRHDPEHEGARHALGYSRIDGRWARQDEVMERQGYVRSRGAWRLPQEIALEQMAEAAEQKKIQWRKNIKLWSGWITRGRGRGAEGRANLLGIRDRDAAPALAELVTDQSEPAALRAIYLEVLAEIGGPAAEAALTVVAAQDGDEKIRDRCLDYLAKWQSRYAVSAFVKLLEHDENLAVRRAAVGLARLRDPAATMPLIEAIFTEHKRVIGGGAGLSPSFNSQGGGGLSVGGGPKVIKQTVKNEDVLAALRTLHPNVNIQYDEDRWRQWFVQQNLPGRVSLRRSQ
jgi:hypothetical protein